MARAEHSFVCVPAVGPPVPASVLERARAAVRDGTAETFHEHYAHYRQWAGNFCNMHYELEHVHEDRPEVHQPAAYWAIRQWPAGGLVHGEWTVLRRGKRTPPSPDAPTKRSRRAPRDVD